MWPECRYLSEINQRQLPRSGVAGRRTCADELASSARDDPLRLQAGVFHSRVAVNTLAATSSKTTGTPCSDQFRARGRQGVDAAHEGKLDPSGMYTGRAGTNVATGFREAL